MNTISKFLKKIQDTINVSQINLEEYEIYYRGESKNYPTTIPSVFRERYLQNEHKIFRELELRYPNIFDNAKSTIDKLTIMQHYGLPTRLLDFTTNPLLALYMAIDTTDYENFYPLLKIIFVKKENIKYYDSDTVSIFSNFSKIDNILDINLQGYCSDNGNTTYVTRGDIAKSGFRYLTWENSNSFTKEENYNLGELICEGNGDLQYLLHEIKGEKSYFKDMIWPKHLNKSVLFIKPKQNTQRIINQAGLFAIFGLNEGKKESFSLEECQNINNFKIKSFKINIKISKMDDAQKESFIEDTKKYLSTLGISYDKVYPEIEYSAKYIKKLYT